MGPDGVNDGEIIGEKALHAAFHIIGFIEEHYFGFSGQHGFEGKCHGSVFPGQNGFPAEVLFVNDFFGGKGILGGHEEGKGIFEKRHIGKAFQGAGLWLGYRGDVCFSFADIIEMGVRGDVGEFKKAVGVVRLKSAVRFQYEGREAFVSSCIADVVFFLLQKFPAVRAGFPVFRKDFPGRFIETAPPGVSFTPWLVR